MYFDALTMEAVIAELRESLTGGRIQRVLLPNEYSVGLEIYARGQRHQLLLSAHPQRPRLHLVTGKLTRGGERVTPLLLLLRKYVRGGKLEALEQPPLERVVALSITKFPHDRKDEDLEDDEPSEPTRVELILEIVGRSSNILLINDGNMILECLRHVPGDAKRRSLVPHAAYELPPRQQKRNPRTTTADGIRSLMEDGAPTLARALVVAYDGISPQVGKEIAARTLGSSDAPLTPDAPFEHIAETLALLARGEERRPCLARDEEGRSIAFAPYWLQQYTRVEPQPSVNMVAELAYSQAEQLTAHGQRREQALRELAAAQERVRRRVESLETELERARRLEQLRWEGEMIYGFLHELQPGQRELVVEGQPITLDPRLSGAENAQARFREYEKAKGALAGVPERLEEAQAQLAYLAETQVLLELAEGYEEIQQIVAEIQERGLLRPSGKDTKGPRRRRPSAGRKAEPLRMHTADGALIFVGKTANQNEEVTFRLSRSDDLWLHARNMPGAHVILRGEGQEPSEAAIVRAAELAAYYSQGRASGAVEVDIARRKHVRRIPGGQPGLVTYQPERTVRVAPRGPEDE